MIIKKVIAHHFKGCKDGEYSLFDIITNIKGENGSGKSTLASVFYWVFCDCDYSMVKNPNVIPTYMEEAEPTGTVVMDINGTTVEVTKVQKNKVVHDGDLVKRSSTNRYMVNNVPMTERDFKSKMLSYGIEVDKILPLSHPALFTSQKATEQKKILFEMTTSRSDYDVAKMQDETAELAKLLKDYNLDEVLATYKASKKKADEASKDIPAQIIGMESSKVVDDSEEWKKKITALQLERKTLKEKIAEMESKNHKASNDVRKQLFEAQRVLLDAEKDLDKAEHDFKKSLVEATLDAKRKLFEKEQTIAGIDSKVRAAENTLVLATAEKKRCGDRWRSLKAEKYPDIVLPKKITDKDLICPTCGQPLPEKLKKERIASFEAESKAITEGYERGKAAWQKKRDAEMEKVKQEGQKACDDIRECEKQMESLAGMKERQLAEKKDLERAVEKAQENELTTFAPQPYQLQNVDKAKERVSYLTQLLEAGKDIAESDEMMTAIERLHECEDALVDADKHIALIDHNKVIDRDIERLQIKKLEYEQEKANAEMILDQCDYLSKRKNELLVEEINSHFQYVKWQLFEYQKNGGYKEVCIPTIDGFRFGESTNTGREIIAKLDICNSLQKFYGMNLPIFLDNAESLNSSNIPKIDSQLILLSVTDDKELVISAN